MESFFRENYWLLTKGFEILAVVTGFVSYKKYKSSNAKYFIHFLLYVAIIDVLGSYNKLISNEGTLMFLKGTLIEKNFWWYTLFWKIGAIMFFAFYYQKILSNKSFKDTIKTVSVIFIIFALVYIIVNWSDFFILFFPIISIWGALIIFLCSVFYFIEILQSDKVLSFYKSLNFYISAAIFIWWLIITPLVFYDVYLTYEVDIHERDWNFIFLRWQIYLFANIVMYSTFTFALIWCKPEREINE